MQWARRGEGERGFDVGRGSEGRVVECGFFDLAVGFGGGGRRGADLVSGEMGGWEAFVVVIRGRLGGEEFAQPGLAGAAGVAFWLESKRDACRGNWRRDCEVEEEQEGER